MHLNFDLGQIDIEISVTGTAKRKRKNVTAYAKKYISMEYKFKNECILKSSPECS